MHYAGISTYQFIPCYASAIHILKPFEDSKLAGLKVDIAKLPMYSTVRHWDVQYSSNTHCDVPALQVKVVVEYKGRSAYTLLEGPSFFSSYNIRQNVNSMGMQGKKNT